MKLEENTQMGMWNANRRVPQTESKGTPTCKNGWQPNKLISSPQSRSKIRRVRGQGKMKEENFLTTGIWLIMSDATKRN